MAVGLRCGSQAFLFMAEVVQDAQPDFWQSPVVLETVTEGVVKPPPTLAMAEACLDCGSEFMISAKFCHACGSSRPAMTLDGSEPVFASAFTRSTALARQVGDSLSTFWRNIAFPAWLRYLHFHEIQRSVGLSTASLIAFIIGLGCVAGAIGISLFYKASNLAEFQAIQMWRIEWLLGATAAFVAGILLKKPSDHDNS